MSSNELLISADSHVIEDPRLWVDRLPSRFQSQAPAFPERGVGGQFQKREGGWDPEKRLTEMEVDGVVGEVLYPSLAMNLFGLPNQELQEACFTVYNDWILEYCATAPDRLFGVAMLCTYDIDHAIAELERCKNAGLRGAMVWEVPPANLSFGSSHYDPLWEAAQELQVPISLHILTGETYPWPRGDRDNRFLMRARHANSTLIEAANALSDIITTGALERFPRLNLVIVESEASWLPFLLSRWDKFYKEKDKKAEFTDALSLSPTEYFERQVYATFFNDHALSYVLGHWGTHNCMWSNDYPHGNSTWPHSREVIQRDLGHLSDEERTRVISRNVTELYKLPALAAVGS